MCPDLGYKLLGCLCPIPLRSSLKFKLHEAAAVATINGKGSEASKVGPIAIWHRPAFAFSLNCDIRYMCESHNSCRFQGPQSHQFLSDPSHCNQQAHDQEAKGTPVSIQRWSVCCSGRIGCYLWHDACMGVAMAAVYSL